MTRPKQPRKPLSGQSPPMQSFTPAVRTEYNQYLTQDAIKTFPDKVFSILHNESDESRMRAGCRRGSGKRRRYRCYQAGCRGQCRCREICRGNEYCTSRHSIFAELRENAGRPSQRQHESYEPIDGAKFDLQANRTYTTLQNRGRTLFRKTGRPGRAGYIRRSEKKGQST